MLIKPLLWRFLGTIIIVFIISCKSQVSIDDYDPGKPSVINNFYPDSGGIATKFMIVGENFGNDIENVKVYFNDKPSQILNVKNEAIYCLVPKQPGDFSAVSVVVGGDSITFNGKKFIYHIASSVSTVTGKAKESGGTDGTMAEATFNLPRYVAVDNDDNIFVVDNQIYKLRLVSQKENKTLTLSNNQISFSQPLFNEDKSTLYITTDNDQTIYAFDSETQWILEKIGKYDNAGYHHSLALGANPNYFFTRKNSGDLLRINKNDMRPETTKILGRISQISGGQNGHMVYNPVDGNLYCSNNQDNMIYKIVPSDDYETVEVIPYAGNGVGWADGPVDQAKFNFPRGIAVDSEGNILVCDQNNHCIRKISLDGIVTTIAGQHGQAGYEDGSPEKALFNQPTGIAVDRNDIIFIADQNNHSIRKLAIE